MRLVSRLECGVVFIMVAVPAMSAQAGSGPSTEMQEHIQRVQAGLMLPVIVKGDPHARHSLQERMAALHVPGVSIAVIHHGEIEWAKGFGVMGVGGTPVTPDTLFQAGSISKPVAALAGLKLVQDGKLSLDADVNAELKNWKLPYGPEANGKVVTLRELLSHTGGLTVHGFPGYAAGEPVPTLVQVLDGKEPTNTPAIRVETKPGTKWNYSGGGYTIMQQMMIDASGKTFPKLLEEDVLTPIGMKHSTFQQPLPKEWQTAAATPYEGDGRAVAGGAHTYPEMAAAGLWTTPTDLARYAIELQRSLQGEANHVLSREMTSQMLTAGMGDWGLGIEVKGSKTDHPYFMHAGVDAGFESQLVAYEKGGEGAVVMTNAQGGRLLVDEVLRSVAAAYGWPDFNSVVRASVTVDPKMLSRYEGTFALRPNYDLVIALKDGHLTVEAAGLSGLVMVPESPTRFFLLDVDAEIEFPADPDGKVSHLVLHQDGEDHQALKK